MGLLETAKDAAKLAQQLGSIELREKIVELQTQLMELLDENRKLRDDVHAAEERLRLRGKVVFRDRAYWLPREDGDDGPFCTKCFDDEGKLIRRIHSMDDRFRCPKCDDHVSIPSGPGAHPRQYPTPPPLRR